MQSRLLAIALVLSLSSIASADMIPSCPPGQHAQMNPVPEGAMHHAGGSCVPDPAPTEPSLVEPPPAPPAEVEHTEAAPAAQGGGCSVGGRSSGAAWLAQTGLLFAIARSLRGRRRAPARCARP